jgi:hypothetical protein
MTQIVPQPNPQQNNHKSGLICGVISIDNMAKFIINSEAINKKENHLLDIKLFTPFYPYYTNYVNLKIPKILNREQT